MEHIYIRLDCDNVGDSIEFALYQLDYSKAQAISNSIKLNIGILSTKIATEFKGDIFLLGSDDLFFKVLSSDFDIVIFEKLKEDFFKKTDITISVGIGKNILEAMQNLKIAKVSGKNKIVGI